MLESLPSAPFAVAGDRLPEFAEALAPLSERCRTEIAGFGQVALAELQPALHLGYEARRRFHRFPFSAIEPHLASEWSSTQRGSRLGWEDVRQTALRAWLHRDDLERGAAAPASRRERAHSAGV
jgi:hypothetical protein